MGNLRSESPTARRIVLSFLDFLKSVELAPGVDSEALDVVRECLEEVFKLNSSSTGDGIRPGLLMDLFTSQEAGEQCSLRPDCDSAAIENTSRTTSSSQKIEDSETSRASNGEDSARDSHESGGMPRDELFGRFYAALDQINFFTSSPGAVEDPDQIAKATQFFNEAIAENGNSQGQIMNLESLAEAFKSKAVQLDPTNKTVQENIQVTVQKLMEQRAQADPNQNTRSRHGQESTTHSGPTNGSFPFPSFSMGASPDFVANILRNMTSGNGQQSATQPAGSANSGAQFTSFPVNIPPEFANILGNMASTSQGHERMPDRNVEGSNEPGIRLDANINLDIGDSPEQVSDVLRSVMQMFSPQLGSQGGMPRGSDGTQGSAE